MTAQTAAVRAGEIPERPFMLFGQQSFADPTRAPAGALSGGGAFADGFHTYAVEWTPDAITWYVDDVQFQRRTRAEVGDGWVYDHPFFVVLSIAVGGGWPGSPDASTALPQRMVVDHVRLLDLGS